MDGQETIAANGNINVDNLPDPTVGTNLYYYCGGTGAVNPNVIAPGCTDLLGLDAQGSVAIGPQQYVQTAWQYQGTGAGSWFSYPYSQPISVTPGATYSVSADINGMNVTGGNPYVGVFLSSGIPAAFQNPGVNGVVSSTFVVPAGETQLQVLVDTDNSTVTAGQPLTWSNIRLTPITNGVPGVPIPLGSLSTWNTQDTTQGTANGDFSIVPAELPPTVVDAAITALGNTPGVSNSNGSIYGAQWQTPKPNKQNPSCLIDAPDLTINGAMISQYQGTFGQYLGLHPPNPCLLSGYHKHFFWDSRLAYEQPPFALSPGSTNFVETGLVEVSRP